MNKEIGELLVSYDTSDLIEQEVEHRMSHKEDYEYDEDISRERVENEVSDDHSFFDDSYTYICEEVGEHFNKLFKTKCAKVEATNLTWDNKSGYKYINLSHCVDLDQTGRQLIASLFSGGDFTLKCHEYENGLYFRISHHDVPMGSSFYLTPCTEKEYNKHSK